MIEKENKIKKQLENNNNTLKHIYLIYLNKIWLEEISRNNPLKVIYSKSEYDNNIDNKKILWNKTILKLVYQIGF